MPNPASAGLPNPASYIDLGNAAVRDNLTCLVWEKTPDTTQGYWQDRRLERLDHCLGEVRAVSTAASFVQRQRETS
jgi:hypothetical protein